MTSPDELRVVRDGTILVDGKWRPSVTETEYVRNDPYGGSVAGRYSDGDAEDARLAISSARRSFDEGPWRALPVRERAAVLERVAGRLEDEADRFAAILTAEVGQPGQLRYVARAAQSLRYYAHLLCDWRQEAVTNQRVDALGIIAREPVGVVGALLAWNLPLSMAHKLIPAVGVGCSTLIKPAHYSAGAVVEFAQLFLEEGLPPGVLNVVTSQRSNGAEVGQAIASSDDVDMVTFTGSSRTGSTVMSAAAGNVKKLTLELGGKSPHVIFADPPSLEHAIEAAFDGAMQLAGQACVAGSRILVHADIEDTVLEGLLDRCKTVRQGDPRDPNTTMGPLVSDRQLKMVESLVEQKSELSTLVAGGRRPSHVPPEAPFYEATIFSNVPPDCPLAQEEIFGPILTVTPFASLDEAIRLANYSRYGLAAGVWTSDLDRALRFSRGVEAGTVWVNSYRTAGLEGLPAGGHKHSGLGREHGREGLEAFTEEKSIHVRLAKDPVDL